MTNEKITLLVLTTCLQCKALKDLLNEHDIAFESTEVDLLYKDERDELFAQMKVYNEKKAFPVTYIGDEIIVGYQKRRILETLGLS
ncbi:MAG: glutaredoxin family protein [Desulfofustis sp.]|jgi:glutaredoxin-like protein NrdH